MQSDAVCQPGIAGQCIIGCHTLFSTDVGSLAGLALPESTPLLRHQQTPGLLCCSRRMLLQQCSRVPRTHRLSWFAHAPPVLLDAGPGCSAEAGTAGWGSSRRQMTAHSAAHHAALEVSMLVTQTLHRVCKPAQAPRWRYSEARHVPQQRRPRRQPSARADARMILQCPTRICCSVTWPGPPARQPLPGRSCVWTSRKAA